jgi:hypothetical protein
MADRNKFEEMLERLINEDKAGAEELFHEIVVEKSRDIYESLLEDEADVEEAADEEVDEAADEEVDESDEDLDEAADEDDDEDEEMDEGFDLDEFEVEADDEPEMDMGMDMGDEEDEGEEDEGEEGDMEDRVEDLEDALDDLKAEFEKMMAGDDEGEEGDDDMGGDATDDMEDDLAPEEESFAFEAEEEDDEEEVEESAQPKSARDEMREYVEKVSATMGDNGANTKSTVAGKNDMGGTAANIVSGGESKSEGTQGGLANPSSKEDNAGNVNVPGGKASKSMKSQPGHGAEKKGKPETADNKKSIVGK